jgi:hypothetical protein
MTYTELLVISYDVARQAHDLGERLSKVTASKGNVTWPEGTARVLCEFLEVIHVYGSIKEYNELGGKSDETRGTIQ